MTELEVDADLLDVLATMARTEGYEDINALLADYAGSWLRDRLGADAFQR